MKSTIFCEFKYWSKVNMNQITSGAMGLLKSIASNTVQYLRELLLSNSSFEIWRFILHLTLVSFLLKYMIFNN